jgi:hypothetical protein
MKRIGVDEPGSEEKTYYCKPGWPIVIGILLSNTSEGSTNQPPPRSLLAVCKMLRASG